MSAGCPKCGYVRRAEDQAPSWQCASCGVAVEKFRSNSAREAAASRQRYRYDYSSRDEWLTTMFILCFGAACVYPIVEGGFSGRSWTVLLIAAFGSLMILTGLHGVFRPIRSTWIVTNDNFYYDDHNGTISESIAKNDIDAFRFRIESMLRPGTVVSTTVAITVSVVEKSGSERELKAACFSPGGQIKLEEALSACGYAWEIV